MIAHRNIIKDFGRVLFWYPLRWIVLILPFGLVYRLCGLLGRLEYALSGRRQTDRMRQNIERAFGCSPTKADAILRRNVENHAMNMMEFLKYPQVNPRNCSSLVVWEGREHLDAALTKGRGVVLCTAHFGAKQILQVALGHAGYRVNQINYHLEGDRLSFVQKNVAQRNRMRIEARIPCRFISAGRFLRAAFRCLHANEILIVAADGAGRKENMDDSFHPFPFLGRTMLFPTNYVELARRTGAVLAPVFAIREQAHHRIVFFPPLDTETGDPVRQYIALLERHVRQYPHLWEFWEEFEEGELLVN
ncbi:MAG: lysophospholipid acyltransferase family protein [Kiritimatiellae bacterium]|nr:lysophospholipid acyltransferase family protein [Kiritimatiellia bacterium]